MESCVHDALHCKHFCAICVDDTRWESLYWQTSGLCQHHYRKWLFWYVFQPFWVQHNVQYIHAYIAQVNEALYKVVTCTHWCNAYHLVQWPGRYKLPVLVPSSNSLCVFIRYIFRLAWSVGLNLQAFCYNTKAQCAALVERRTPQTKDTPLQCTGCLYCLFCSLFQVGTAEQTWPKH